MPTMREKFFGFPLETLDKIVKKHIDAGVCQFDEDEDWQCGNLRGHHEAQTADEVRKVKRAWVESQKPGAAPTSYPGRQHLTIKSIPAREVLPGMVMSHRGKPGTDQYAEYVEVLTTDDDGRVMTFRRTNDPEARRFVITYEPDDSLTVWVVTPAKKEKS